MLRNDEKVYLLPALLGLKQMKVHIEVIKELGGRSIGAAPMFMGFLYAIPNSIESHWIDDLKLVEWI
ncbi:MAG: hypothetical protein Q7R79_05455 [bacterium]|nr:hypothetical protein [bacterium]